MLEPYQILETSPSQKLKVTRNHLYHSKARQLAVREKRSTLGAHNNLIPRPCNHLMQTLNPQDLELLYRIQIDKEKRVQSEQQEKIIRNILRTGTAQVDRGKANKVIST